jgi:HEPN domain-containing protein
MMHRGVAAWRETAREDMELARLAAANGHLAPAAFHCQQAAEKILRALLLLHHVEAREHSLVELLEMLEKQARAVPPPEIVTAARKLDPHYIQARYPGPHGPRPSSLYDDTILEELLACAEEISRWAEALLST